MREIDLILSLVNVHKYAELQLKKLPNNIKFYSKNLKLGNIKINSNSTQLKTS